MKPDKRRKKNLTTLAPDFATWRLLTAGPAAFLSRIIAFESLRGRGFALAVHVRLRRWR
jgi:hypothetical protein